MSSEIDLALCQIHARLQGGVSGLTAWEGLREAARAVLEKAQSLAVEDGWVRLEDLERLFEEKKGA